MSSTSRKLPEELKRRLAKMAANVGLTPLKHSTVRWHSIRDRPLTGLQYGPFTQYAASAALAQ
jgi:hypothetical protein